MPSAQDQEGVPVGPVLDFNHARAALDTVRTFFEGTQYLVFDGIFQVRDESLDVGLLGGQEDAMISLAAGTTFGVQRIRIDRLTFKNTVPASTGTLVFIGSVREVLAPGRRG